MEIYKLFARPDRELACKIIIDGQEYNDEYVKNLKIVSGLSGADTFEIGSFMSTLKLTLIDKDANFNSSQFVGKTAKVEIGIKTEIEVGFDIEKIFIYEKVGEFILSTPTKNGYEWVITGNDLMEKLGKKYECSIEFPTTYKAILQDISNQCGVSLSDNLINCTGDYSALNNTIKYKPNFYDATCRDVVAQIAEILTGWAYIDVDTQKLDVSLVKEEDDRITIDDNNLIEFKEFKTKNDDSKILVDSYKVIQNGAEDFDYQIDNPHKFYFVDNMFIQGNPETFTQFEKVTRFSSLSALNIKFNGNPCVKQNKILSINSSGIDYKFIPLMRTLNYDGGLSEEYICNQIEYELRADRKKQLVRHIEKVDARLLVLDDKIESKVSSDEVQSLIEQTKDEIDLSITNKVSETEEKITNLSLKTESIESEVKKKVSSSDYETKIGEIETEQREQRSLITQTEQGILSTVSDKIDLVQTNMGTLVDGVNETTKNLTSKMSTIEQKADSIELKVKSVNRNLCTESEEYKTGNDIYFATERLLANVEYRVEFYVVNANNVEDIYIYGNTLPKKKTRYGKNIHKVKYNEDKNSVNIYPCGSDGRIRSVYVYKDDGNVLSDEIISFINLTPESAKIKAYKIELDGDVVVHSINEDSSTTIQGGKIRAGSITANEIASDTITSAELKSGSITTDILYPGAQNRIVLEQGYSPGSNNCKSIDSNGDAIRFKYNAGNYLKVDNRGTSFLRNGTVQASIGGAYTGMAVKDGTIMCLENNEYSMNCRQGDNFFVLTGGRQAIYADSGGAYAAAFVQTSDVRSKENVCLIDDTRLMFKNLDIKNEKLTSEEIIDFVKNTKFYTYNFRGLDKPKFSTLTQDVKNEKIKNVLVHKASGINKYDSLDLYSYISMLHLALQKEIERNDNLENRLKKLEDIMFKDGI